MKVHPNFSAVLYELIGAETLFVHTNICFLFCFFLTKI